jgi:hypothetical protein
MGESPAKRFAVIREPGIFGFIPSTAVPGANRKRDGRFRDSSSIRYYRLVTI